MKLRNKLQLTKELLRKLSIVCMVIGLLLNTYGAYVQASPVLAENGYTDADCAPPNGTGAHLDKVVFAGSTKVGNIGSMLWVKNCSLNNTHQTSAVIYKMICEDQSGRCDKVVETQNTEVINLPPGGTYNFIATDFSLTCGSGTRAIRVNGLSESAATYYQSPNGACTTSPTANPNPVTPTTNQKITLVGRIKEGNSFWQNSQSACGANFASSQNLAVGGYPVNQCNPQPLFNSGEINPGQRTITATGLPAEYVCTQWAHSLYNIKTNSSETVGVGTGCSFTANFNSLDKSIYDGNHHISFTIARMAPTQAPTSVPTTAPTPAITATPLPATPVPTAVPTTVPTSAPTAQPTTVPTIAPQTPTPTSAPTISPTPQVTQIPTATPIATQNTQLKLCKYEDDNADGVHNGSENTLSWTFRYTENGEQKTATSNWWNLLNQGCAIVSVKANAQISVSEDIKPGWRPTAVYADGARADGGIIPNNFTYNYTSNIDEVKVLWFLNTFTPVATMLPTTIPTAQPTNTPTVLPSATLAPSPTIQPTITPTPSPIASATPAPTATSTPSPTVISSPAVVKICKYEDMDGDGLRENGDNVLSWTFNYEVNGQTRSVNSRWWHAWTNGCAEVDLPDATRVTISESNGQGWTLTGMYADGAKTDGSQYTYTTDKNNKKEIWFLNHQTPNTNPSPTPTPTTVPTSNTNYNATIEKRVLGTNLDNNTAKIEYTIKVRNNSTSENLNNFEIRDTLPASFTYDNNSASGDIAGNPEIQDVSGDDNRRLVWKVSVLEKGKEINIRYRTSGTKEDKNYCNDARLEKEGNLVASSQACVRIDRASTAVLGVSTDRTLPATGAVPAFATGMFLVIAAGLGLKLSRHVE